MSAVVTQSLATAASANDLDTLIQSTCIACHDADTETRLDFAALGKDFENEQSFRTWVHVFDTILEHGHTHSFGLYALIYNDGVNAWIDFWC